MAHNRLQPAIVTNKKSNAKQRDFCEKTELIFCKSQNHDKEADIKHPETWALFILVAFLLLNLGCFILLESRPHPGQQLTQLLGPVPQVLFINIACALFLFTELIQLLCRDTGKVIATQALKQFLFLTSFYFFFWTAGALQQSINVLLFSGMGLIGGEYFRLLRIARKITTGTFIEER